MPRALNALEEDIMPHHHAPTIRDDMLFEALLKQGCAVERAARIAHVADPLEPKARAGRSAGGTKEEVVEALRKG